MPVFSVKCSHVGHETVIDVRADSEQVAREHVQKMHAYDYLSLFKSIPHAERKVHANRCANPYSDVIEPGHPYPGAKVIVSVEVAKVKCWACGTEHDAQ